MVGQAATAYQPDRRQLSVKEPIYGQCRRQTTALPGFSSYARSAANHPFTDNYPLSSRQKVVAICWGISG